MHGRLEEATRETAELKTQLAERAPCKPVLEDAAVQAELKATAVDSATLCAPVVADAAVQVELAAATTNAATRKIRFNGMTKQTNTRSV